VALPDLDNGGDLDAFIASNGANKVQRNGGIDPTTIAMKKPCQRAPIVSLSHGCPLWVISGGCGGLQPPRIDPAASADLS
jgi:hypothetical protein